MTEIILGLAVVGYLLVAPAFGIYAFVRLRDMERELAGLRLRLAGTAPEPAAPPAPEPADSPWQAAAVAEPAVIEPTAAAVPARPLDLERLLTGNLMVWLGAATVALGGAFLIRYSIQEGLIGPTARVVAGLLLAAALLGAGEWLRQGGRFAPSGPGAAHLPAAVSAAGVFTGFASVYGAYALYGLVDATAGFVGLAGMAAVALVLSLRQGALLAVAGLLGGYLTPWLVETGDPHAWPLFLYLIALNGAGLAVARLYRWWPLAWAVLAGAAVWPVLWLAVAWRPDDGAALAVYLLSVAAMLVGTVSPAGPAGQRPLRRVRDVGPRESLLGTGAAAVAVLAFCLLRRDDYGTASLVLLFALAAGSLAAAHWRARLLPLAGIAALLVLAAVAAWHLPQVLADPYAARLVEWQRYIPGPRPVVPPELSVFLSVTVAVGALFALAGFAGALGRRQPGRWAVLSAAVPLLLLLLAYWRAGEHDTEIAWAAAGPVLALLATAALDRVRRQVAPAHLAAQAAYAAAAVAALSLGFAIGLERAWLTVALALEVPALALIAERLAVPALRRLALSLAVAVLVRLVLNPFVLDYEAGPLPLVNWASYGYGLPALAFWWSARRFRRAGDDALVAVLEAGWIAFALMFATLQLHLLFQVTLGVDDPWGFAERSLQVVLWLAVAGVLYHRPEAAARTGLRWLRRAVAALAGLGLLVQLLANPWLTGEAVGGWPVLNLIGLGYAVPAGLLALTAGALHRDGRRRSATVTFGAALLFGFVAITLEVRRAFAGGELDAVAVSDGEWYAYSVAWLAYAGVLLALALASGQAALRYASLGLLLVVTLKVFLSDMAALTGLYRALSFLGLGLVLLAIGYLYARFVFPRRPAADSQPSG